MMSLKTKIEFINHASILIESNAGNILCDPWYEGAIFNKGWNLIVESDPAIIENKLDNVKYIWISHEHPDHFSITFFRRYRLRIIERSIVILFQETIDKRVVSYLQKCGFKVREIPVDIVWNLGNFVSITVIKDGFYDSGLFVDNNGEKILNLNDCEVNSKERANEVYRLTGSVDILLTQFSYAAWKGGESNRQWRINAATEKLNAVKLQVSIFKPKLLIPIASYSYFSNINNSYLNDCANTTDDVVRHLKNSDTRVLVLKPHDVIDESRLDEQSKEGNIFWLGKRDSLGAKEYHEHTVVGYEQLSVEFIKYCERVNRNNSRWFMWVLRLCYPLKMLRPVNIRLDDSGLIVVVDALARVFKITDAKHHLSMSSASLSFIFTNMFGYDTLTVNGCFEEGVKGGFVLATKALAVENLNNIGVKLSLNIFTNPILIKKMLGKILSVKKKIDA